jgi:hypothetical protein
VAGDVPCLTSLSLRLSLSLSSDEYKMKGVEEVKYMRGEEERLNARNQENTVREREGEDTAQQGGVVTGNKHTQTTINFQSQMPFVYILPAPRDGSLPL